jgi:hypothetical protein
MSSSIVDELRAREPLFHHPELGDFESLMEPDFWEIGASGRRYDRDFVLAELEKRYSAPHRDEWEIRDFACTEIAPDNYLATYTLIQDGTRVSRRSTIWRRTEGGWRAVYHQGTLVQES